MPMLDHEQTGIAPGARIAEVTDGWIAIAATTDDELVALCTVAGGRCRRAAGHRRARATTHSPHSAPRACRASWSASTSATLLRLRRQRRRRDVARYEHVDYGDVEQPGAFWAFGDLDVKLDRARPASASTPSRCSPRSDIDPDVSRRSSPGAARAWKAATPA